MGFEAQGNNEASPEHLNDKVHRLAREAETFGISDDEKQERVQRFEEAKREWTRETGIKADEVLW